jgi:hypothetical protein
MLLKRCGNYVHLHILRGILQSSDDGVLNTLATPPGDDGELLLCKFAQDPRSGGHGAHARRTEQELPIGDVHPSVCAQLCHVTKRLQGELLQHVLFVW